MKFFKATNSWLAVVSLCVGGSAVAHHSFAAFNMDKTVTLNGTVRTLEWTNPHAWLWIYVTDDKGQQQVWGLEAAAPGEMMRNGWSKNSLKPGDKVTIEAHPLRDGRNGGSLMKVTTADGHVMGSAAPQQAGGAPQAK